MVYLVSNLPVTGRSEPAVPTHGPRRISEGCAKNGRYLGQPTVTCARLSRVTLGVERPDLLGEKRRLGLPQAEVRQTTAEATSPGRKARLLGDADDPLRRRRLGWQVGAAKAGSIRFKRGQFDHSPKTQNVS